MSLQKETACLIKQEQLAEDVYSLWLETKQIAGQAKPGQFVSVYLKDGARLLPRPISICEIRGNGLRLVYRVVGAGTREMSGWKEGEPVLLLGPLGNGFPLKNKKALLIGGGIGIPPLLELAGRLENPDIVLGYQKGPFFLSDEFQALGTVYLATQNGEHGTRGTVVDALNAYQLHADVIYACGPTPMLKAVKEFAGSHQIEAWLSLEERMGCGIGACLSCVCRTTGVDPHTNVNNSRICKDGPVFLATEVEL